MQPRHPLGMETREVVVHRDEVHALAGERVEVARQRRDERLALAGLHLGDPPEVHRGAAHDLDVEVALAERALAGLADDRERLRQHLGEAVLFVVVLRSRPRSRRSLKTPVMARSSSSDLRSISGFERAATSGTSAWTAFSFLPSPACSSFWNKLMHQPSGVRGDAQIAPAPAQRPAPGSEIGDAVYRRAPRAGCAALRRAAG